MGTRKRDGYYWTRNVSVPEMNIRPVAFFQQIETLNESRKMTDQKIIEAKLNIDKLSQMEMASLQRSAPSGHPYFDNRLPLWDHFKKRFKELGGMTPEISKAIGWN